MKIELISSSHSYGEANYHLQFTAAYRKPIFEDDATRILTRDYILAAGKKHNITISAIGFGHEHCHVFTTNCKNHSAAESAKLLKGFSSYMMRSNHRDFFRNHLWGDKFWTGGYFYRTVGAINSETVKRYVEDTQQKHWNNDHAQRKLIEFGAN
jgi:REP element-mobilizing transposase RayT